MPADVLAAGQSETIQRIGDGLQMPLRQVQVLSSDLQIYITPAVIYFSSVLLMSALLTVPNQTRLTALICICLEGAAGPGYSGSLAIRQETGSAFCEARSDLFP